MGQYRTKKGTLFYTCPLIDEVLKEVEEKFNEKADLTKSGELLNEVKVVINEMSTSQEIDGAIDFMQKNLELRTRVVELLEDIRKINHSLRDLEAENEKLKNENEDLEAENEKLKKENEYLEEEITDLKGKIRDLKDVIENLENNK